MNCRKCGTVNIQGAPCCAHCDAALAPPRIEESHISRRSHTPNYAKTAQTQRAPRSDEDIFDDYVALALPLTATNDVNNAPLHPDQLSDAFLGVIDQDDADDDDDDDEPTLDFVIHDEEKELTGHPFLDLYAGKKPHRKSSLPMDYKEYYLKWPIRDKMLTKVIWRNKDNRLLYADYVYKINPKMKKQERVILLSNKSVYLLPDASYDVNRKIRFQEIQGISLSTRGDHFLVIHCDPENQDDKKAVVLMFPRKTEFLLGLQKQFKIRTNRDLILTFSDVINYTLKEDQNFSIRFVDGPEKGSGEYDYDVNPDNPEEIFVSYKFKDRNIASRSQLQKVRDPKYVEKLKKMQRRRKQKKMQKKIKAIPNIVRDN